MNSAAMNMRVNVSFLIKVLSRYMPRSGIAGSYDNSIFSFLRKLHSCTISHQSEWPPLETLQIANAGEDVEKSPPTLLVGMQIGTATMENSREIPQKTKNRPII